MLIAHKAVHRFRVRGLPRDLYALRVQGRLPVRQMPVTACRYPTDRDSSPKLIPWFVSDVTPPDFKSAISSLLSPTFFPESETTGAVPTPQELPESREHLRVLVTRWAGYLESGVFALSVPPETPLGGLDPKVEHSAQLLCGGLTPRYRQTSGHRPTRTGT